MLREVDGQHHVMNMSAVMPSVSTESSQKQKNGVIKKRGRPPKAKPDSTVDAVPLKQTKVTDSMKKTRRQIDR